MSKVCVILCAGGIGSRMKTDIPKQFLSLADKPVALHSFEVFASMPEVEEIIIACDPTYRSLFQLEKGPVVTFALPGERRQDSIYNALVAATKDSPFYAIHDAARPLISAPLVRRVIQAAVEKGAATAGMPVKFSVKKALAGGLVDCSLDRNRIWEIQTPQVIETSLLKRGFKKAREENLTVTDDVSLVELLNLPVQLVEGSYSNLKLTTPEDLAIATSLLASAPLV